MVEKSVISQKCRSTQALQTLQQVDVPTLLIGTAELDWSSAGCLVSEEMGLCLYCIKILSKK